MSEQEGNVVKRIPPGAQRPAIPGSPVDAPMYTWPRQDTAVHTYRQMSPSDALNSQVPSYFTSPTLHFPEPQLYPSSVPPRHPTQIETSGNNGQTWHPPQPVLRAVSHQSTLRPPSYPRPRAISSTGPGPRQQLLPQHSSHSLKHKYSYSSDIGSDLQGINEDIDDAFDVSSCLLIIISCTRPRK